VWFSAVVRRITGRSVFRLPLPAERRPTTLVVRDDAGDRQFDPGSGARAAAHRQPATDRISAFAHYGQAPNGPRVQQPRLLHRCQCRVSLAILEQRVATPFDLASRSPNDAAPAVLMRMTMRAPAATQMWDSRSRSSENTATLRRSGSATRTTPRGVHSGPNRPRGN